MLDSPKPPRVLSIAGLKKSGKTTVATALIRELLARGLRVGSAKTFRHHPLSLDQSGVDTRRHAEAGAEFTVAILDDELVYFEPRASRPGLRDAARLFPPGVDYVVWEGTADPEAGGGQVVCLRRLSDFTETVAERRIDPGRSSPSRESRRKRRKRPGQPTRRWASRFWMPRSRRDFRRSPISFSAGTQMGGDRRIRTGTPGPTRHHCLPARRWLP